MAVSNNLISLLNFIALMCSIPIISAGIYLSSTHHNHCITWLRFPIIFIGIIFFLVTLSGFIGSYYNKQALLAFFLFAMAFLIIILLVILVLAFVVARPSGAYSVDGKGYSDYRLRGYSQWLRDHVVGDDNWGGIRKCIVSSHVCEKLSQKYVSPEGFYAAHLSPIQSGCCKPPAVCGYQYVNPIVWVNPVNPVSDADCTLWNNEQIQLCYNCDSCKAGLLESVRKEWRKANIILIVAVVVLIWVYLIACCAYKNAQTEDIFRRYKQGWT